MAADKITRLLNTMYPIGSIYMSVNSANPGTLFGGTWERITGRFLLAATDGGSSGASQAAGNTGGEAEHTLTGAESGQKALSISGGGHNHTVTYHFKTQNVASGSGATLALGDGSGDRSSTAVATTTANTGSHSHTVSASDATNAHNNMPPYLSVYVWKRTA